MIKNQGYWMDLECSDCGDRETITGKGKQEVIRNARQEGWSLSQSSLSCWCPSCKDHHKYSARAALKRPNHV